MKGKLLRLLLVLAVVCSFVAMVAAPASADVGATLSKTSGPVGTPVTVTVTGAIASAYLYVEFDGVRMTTIPAAPQADTSGNGAYGFTIPAAKAGAHTVTATDGVTSDDVTFTVEPKVTISPTSGIVGTAVTVTGTGFTPGYSGTVFIGAGNLTLAAFSGVVDSNGGVTASGTIPGLASGAQQIAARDNAGAETPPANYATFTVKPSVAVDPTSGLAGTTVTLTGRGWTIAGNVSVSFAGGGAATVFTNVPNTGEWSVDYPTPATAAIGASQIKATDTGGLSATATFTVVARALTLTPASGPRGTSVMITGANMSTGVGHSIGIGNLTFGANVWNLTQTITIDTGGTISPTTLTVFGNATVGTNTVSAKDDQGLIATATFTVTKPTIAISPTTGPKGSTVVVTGAGWLAGKQVSIKIGTTVVQTVTPDATGNIAATATVPADLAGNTATFTAGDAYDNSSAAVIFTVPGASITVTPSSGVATTTVAVAGTGFGPYMPVTVKIGTYAMTTQALTDATGVFTYTFNVPGLAPGVQVITATDLAPTSATTFFTITAAPVSIANQLAGISTQLVRVWGYFGGQWQLYDPADPAGSDLATLTAGRGYWINASAAAQLIYQAYSYSLTAGWNLIGWR